MKHEEFAERAAERLEATADRLHEEAGRLHEEAGRLGINGTVKARANEMRVAAMMVRDEATLVERVENDPSAESALEGNPPVEAQT